MLLTELNVPLTLPDSPFTTVTRATDQGQHHGILDGRRAILGSQEASNFRDHAVHVLDSFVRASQETGWNQDLGFGLPVGRDDLATWC